jgi:tetratricopeptide (TPR) repeat protein
MDGKRLLMIAWTAADWAEVHPALDRGELPHLQKLVDTGTSGMLTSLPPLSVPIVAASIATGRHPEHHSVLAEVEPRADGGGVRPVGQRSWRAPAFWEALAAAGLRTAVLNWPATAPADRWPGLVVDEDFAQPMGRDFTDWPLPPHCVSPASWRAVMADLRVHPCEIGTAELGQLLPRFAEVNPRRDPRPGQLAAALARAASVHAATTHVAEAAEWDLLLVRYTLLGDLATILAGIPAGADATLYTGARPAAYRLLDVMLSRLVELAGPDAACLIVASGGWLSAGPKATRDRAAEAGVAVDRGFLVAAGPGLRADAMLHRASALDICPSVLAYFGLASPSDGRVLDPLFTAGPPPCQPAPTVPRPAPAAGPDPAAHLLALGYPDAPSEAQRRAMAVAALDALRNLADSHIVLREWAKARDALERLLRIVPRDYVCNLNMGRVLLTLGDAAAARPHAETALVARPDLPWGDLLMGAVLATTGATAEAEPHLRRARELGAKTPTVQLRLGWVAVMLRRWADAEAAFRAVLAAEERIAEAHAGLGLALHAQERGEQAEAALRRSIGLVYDNPIAHFHLSQVLAQRGAHAEAAEAARTALAQQPALAEAEELLGRIKRALASGLVAQALADSTRDTGN